MWLPSVLEEDDDRVKRTYDLPSRLMKDRIVFLDSEVTDQSASVVITQLLYLDSQDDEADITLYINSPGGSVSAGFAIYDVMNRIKAPVTTICMGMAASMAAFLLCSGSRGKRYCLPNSTVMIHQPLGGVQGQATEIQITAKRILYLREQLYKIMAKNTGKTFEEIESACERDNYLTPEQAKEFGLIDEVIKAYPKAWPKEGEED